jgi:Flp pilus assembly protein TadD
MPLRRAQTLRLLTACLLLVCACRPARAQDRADASAPLTRIEQSIERGRFDEAEKPLLDYAVSHPKDVRALELLAGLRRRQNRFEEAEALYRRALALDPARDASKINLAHAVYESGRHEEARSLLVEAAKSPHADPRILLSLAEALFLVGEFQKSLAATERLPVALRNTLALPVIAASRLALGERQKLVALIPSMRRAASNAVVATRCAEVLQSAGMNAEAVALLRGAIASAPNDSGVLVSLGRLETASQDFAQARQHLNRAAALEPRSAEILAALAALESAEGNLTAALASLEKARALSPDSPMVLAQLALTAMRANQPRVAVEAAGALLRLNPDEPESLYLFGASSLQRGSLAAARDALERFVAQRPNDARGCLALGITLAGQQDETEAARAQFERCLRLDPSNVEAKYQLGLVLKSEGETAKAIKSLEDVIARSPQHANALRDLGALYLQSGDAARARAVLEKAVALNPQDAETHFQLSRVYNRLGESALAARHLELFQKLKGLSEQEPTSRREKAPTP